MTVCDPLQLTLQVHIEQESHVLLGMALQGQLELLYSKGFKPICVYVDPQSALKSLETKFPNVSIEAAGAKDLPASGWIFARSSGWLRGLLQGFRRDE